MDEDVQSMYEDDNFEESGIFEGSVEDEKARTRESILDRIY